MSKWLRKAGKKTERAKFLLKEFLPLWEEIRKDSREEIDTELSDLLNDVAEAVYPD